MTNNLSQNLELKSSDNAKIKSIRLGVVCVNCGHTWGVSLLADFTYPYRWDVCIDCARRKNDQIKEELTQIYDGKDGIQ